MQQSVTQQGATFALTIRKWLLDLIDIHNPGRRVAEELVGLLIDRRSASTLKEPIDVVLGRSEDGREEVPEV